MCRLGNLGPGGGQKQKSCNLTVPQQWTYRTRGCMGDHIEPVLRSRQTREAARREGGLCHHEQSCSSLRSSSSTVPDRSSHFLVSSSRRRLMSRTRGVAPPVAGDPLAIHALARHSQSQSVQPCQRGDDVDSRKADNQTTVLSALRQAKLGRGRGRARLLSRTTTYSTVPTAVAMTLFPRGCEPHLCSAHPCTQLLGLLQRCRATLGGRLSNPTNGLPESTPSGVCRFSRGPAPVRLPIGAARSTRHHTSRSPGHFLKIAIFSSMAGMAGKPPGPVGHRSTAPLIQQTTTHQPAHQKRDARPNAPRPFRMFNQTCRADPERHLQVFSFGHHPISDRRSQPEATDARRPRVVDPPACATGANLPALHLPCFALLAGARVTWPRGAKVPAM